MHRERHDEPERPIADESTETQTTGARKRLFVLSERSTLALWLTPRERAAIAAQFSGRVSMLDIDNVSALGLVLAAGRAHAVLASAARLDARSLDQLAQLRRSFPGVPLLGLVTHDAADGVVWRAAALGRLGADAVVDVGAGRQGWSMLNDAVNRMPTPLVQQAVAAVSDVLGAAATEGWFRFVAEAFRGDATTVKQIALSAGIHPNRFHARFHQARLPAPRRYVEIGFLARLAHLSESGNLSTAAIANAANASSPQAVHHVVRRLTGLTVSQWRRTHRVTLVLEDFCDRLIEPHREALQGFDPYMSWRQRLL
jgi:AraC-like DNA-binding protein